MLQHLPTLSPDPLWAILSTLQSDPRPEKLDLVVGVYRDDAGNTPTLAAVTAAEYRLADAAPSKTYRGLSGNMGFNHAMTDWLLPKSEQYRATTIQTVGGTGALRLLSDLIASLNPHATLWISNPGYINHEPIARKAGLKVAYYPYLTPSGNLDEAGMLEALSLANAGDVVIVHGCCHNPSGVDFSAEQWETLSTLLARKQLIPLVDIAYLGLGDTIEHDLTGLHQLASTQETVLIAASCSKNMGLYCERTGCAMVLSAGGEEKAQIQQLFEHLARSNYSMPPEHGAAIAHLLLTDPVLKQQWQAELNEMRLRIQQLRDQLCHALEASLGDSRLSSLRQHKGMFSLLPFNIQQMQQLADQYGIYGTKTGRINIAGLREENIEYLAEALVQTHR